MRANPLNDIIHDGNDPVNDTEYSLSEYLKQESEPDKKEEEKPEKMDPEDNIFMFLD